MSSNPALLVLAAGMGSRYGGLKQVDPVGPHGEFILDYSVYDALRAGFRKIVFVIRREMEAAFRETIARRLPREIEIVYAFQELDLLPQGFSVPEGRKKPWGTGHAVWVARECVRQPMLVINADDFYGAAAYQTAADCFASPTKSSDAEYFMVGYRLRKTVSPHGPVARGVCRADAEGFLVDVTEVTGIAVDAAGKISAPGKDGRPQNFTGEEIVSMNLWGFTPSLFDRLEGLFRQFLAAEGSIATAEFYLPAAVAAMVREKRVRVKVLTTAAAGMGRGDLRQDKPVVMERLAGVDRRRRLSCAAVAGRKIEHVAPEQFPPPPKSSSAAAYGQNC